MFCVVKILIWLELLSNIRIRASDSTISYDVNRTYDDITLNYDRESLKPLECEFVPRLIVGSRERELECCNETFRNYYSSWALQSLPLTTFLETLRQWNCPQYEKQCSSRVFAFTDFSKLVYDYFCNYSLLVENCLPQVITAVEGVQKQLNSPMHTKTNTSFSSTNASGLRSHDIDASINSSTLFEWKSAISRIKPKEMTIDKLLQPCIQIAQYDQAEIFGGSYHEVVSVLVPTCELFWCGFSGEAFRTHRISFWTCLSSK